ncbi:hypothetical protein V1509DRAFT_257033 [Lipomyces kononenkoae]
MSDEQSSHVPEEELTPSVSRSSSAGLSPSIPSVVPTLTRSQTWPVPLRLPPASTWQQSPPVLLAVQQALPWPSLQGPIIDSQMRTVQSPYGHPPYHGSQRSVQPLPMLTGEYMTGAGLSRRPSLPPLPLFAESHHHHAQFMMPMPYQPTSTTLSEEQTSHPQESSSLTVPTSQLTGQVKNVRPTRRPKSNVIAACSNCKKAHLACDGMSIFFHLLA